MKGRSRFKDVILPIAIIIAGFAALSPLSDLVAARKPVVPESYNDADLFVKGRELKGFVLGTESLVADWYWMRSLQYIGDKVVNSKEDLRLDDLRNLNPRLLYPLLDSATDLDPHFIAPYAYGAMVLPAIDGNQAIAIAEKGIASNPNEWRLYQQLGYIYWRLKMYDEAANPSRKNTFAMRAIVQITTSRAPVRRRAIFKNPASTIATPVPRNHAASYEIP